MESLSKSIAIVAKQQDGLQQEWQQLAKMQ
jgi:hypothetical protein